jgi:heme iron utilization protein
MPDTIRPTDETSRRLARILIHATRAGTLATLRPPDGHPFASLVSVAPDFDSTPIIVVSSLSGHATNLAADCRCTLLCASAGKGDPLARPRVSVLCQARRFERQSPDGKRARRRFLAFNPKAELYVDFPDFIFYRLEVLNASLNGGFGKAYELVAADILTSKIDAEALAEAEASLLAALNTERATLLQQLANQHAQTPATIADQAPAPEGAGKWRACGLDPQGIDVVSASVQARINFCARVTAPADFWNMAERMVHRSTRGPRPPVAC